MILVGSIWRKMVVSAIAAVALVLFLEVTMLDSQNFPWLRPAEAESVLQPAARGVLLPFAATAYCKGLVTAAGVAAQAGVAAADRTILPLGSVIQIDAPQDEYHGIYSILDTGPSVQGREVNLYMWSCHEALRFGRRPIQLTILRLGWNPTATTPTPTFMDRLFSRPRPEPEQPAPPARPLPIEPSDDSGGL